MDDPTPPPPYTPRDHSRPVLRAEEYPNIASLHLNDFESGYNSGQTYGISSYDHASPTVNRNFREADPQLPPYEPEARPSNVPGTHSEHPSQRQRQHTLPPSQPGVVPHMSTAAPGNRSHSHPVISPPRAAQEVPFGLSALQRIVDLAKELSDRSAGQGTSSDPNGARSKQDQLHVRVGGVGFGSSSPRQPIGSHPQASDLRVLEGLDLTNLRASVANLLRNPQNRGELIDAVNRLRQEMQNRQGQAQLRQNIKEFKANIHENRKKVRAMKNEARCVHRAEKKEKAHEERTEKKEKRCEKRAERKARKAEHSSCRRTRKREDCDQ